MRSTFALVSRSWYFSTFTSGLRSAMAFAALSTFGRADAARGVEDLALQVRGVDRVGVDDAERADAGRGEVERRGAAEPARAEEKHLGS